MDAQRQIIEVEATGKPRRFVFVLLPNFTLLCFAAAMDALRIANRMANKPLYSWVVTGEGGDTVACSAGTEFKLQEDLPELMRDDTVMVCGGLDVQKGTTKKLLNWLRREARLGQRLFRDGQRRDAWLCAATRYEWLQAVAG